MTTTSVEPDAASSWKDSARAFVSYVNQTGSPYHAIAPFIAKMRSIGFAELKEAEHWQPLTPGQCYFIQRNGSSFAAIRIGKHVANNSKTCPRMIIATAHADSPCLRLRPISKIQSDGGALLGVECYGGGLWHTWFDRGLGLAGKVVVTTPDTPASLSERLVRIDEPLCMLPNLAIHLQTADERSAFKINKETQLRPILFFNHEVEENEAAEATKAETQQSRMSEALSEYICSNLSLAPESKIVDADLCLYDVTPARLCGLFGQWIESGRLDNLATLWCAMSAFIEQAEDRASSDDTPDDEIHMCVVYDHEEVGSVTWLGADSRMLEAWVARILASLSTTEDAASASVDVSAVMAKSLLLSMDMAHALHPNYSDRHQNQHKALINGGIVIKENANQRYATLAMTSALTRQVAEEMEVPIQDFVVRNDSPCGSTIGPSQSSRLGVATVDLGIPQWAMHSCRETCGAKDIHRLKLLVKGFLLHCGRIMEASTWLSH